MVDYSACPNCGRRATKSISNNWFPVYKCGNGHHYCKECGGSSCPKCDLSSRSESGKVYA